MYLYNTQYTQNMSIYHTVIQLLTLTNIMDILKKIHMFIEICVTV